jgi:hypothetical protein
VLLCGDFNARTGGLKDYIQNDDMNYNIKDCPVPPTYSPDAALNRNQLYTKANFILHGNLLTKICKSSQLRIVNGRFLGDSLGYFTFFNKNGKSTVYYMLASQNLFYIINSFVVKSPSDLSDHCFISINIQCENKSSNVEEEKLWSLPGTFKWSDQNEYLYFDSLIETDNLENIVSLNKLLDDDSFNDTDLLVDKTNDI